MNETQYRYNRFPPLKDKSLALAILYGGQVNTINLVEKTKFSCKTHRPPR